MRFLRWFVRGGRPGCLPGRRQLLVSWPSFVSDGEGEAEDAENIEQFVDALGWLARFGSDDGWLGARRKTCQLRLGELEVLSPLDNGGSDFDCGHNCQRSLILWCIYSTSASFMRQKSMIVDIFDNSLGLSVGIWLNSQRSLTV